MINISLQKYTINPINTENIIKEIKFIRSICPSLRNALKYELVRRSVLPSHSNIAKIIEIKSAGDFEKAKNVYDFLENTYEELKKEGII